jgi:hypothetical protein
MEKKNKKKQKKTNTLFKNLLAAHYFKKIIIKNCVT